MDSRSSDIKFRGTVSLVLLNWIYLYKTWLTGFYPVDLVPRLCTFQTWNRPNLNLWGNLCPHFDYLGTPSISWYNLSANLDFLSVFQLHSTSLSAPPPMNYQLGAHSNWAECFNAILLSHYHTYSSNSPFRLSTVWSVCPWVCSSF